MHCGCGPLSSATPPAEVKAAAARLDAAQWAKAAALAGGRRSGSECRCHWGAALAASRAPWTPQEHARMMVIAEAHAFADVRPCLHLGGVCACS